MKDFLKDFVKDLSEAIGDFLTNPFGFYLILMIVMLMVVIFKYLTS